MGKEVERGTNLQKKKRENKRNGKSIEHIATREGVGHTLLSSLASRLYQIQRWELRSEMILIASLLNCTNSLLLSSLCLWQSISGALLEQRRRPHGS